MKDTPVDVLALFNAKGIVRPVAIVYAGKQHPISVIKVENAAQDRGIGRLYTCYIDKRERLLWRFGDNWYLQERWRPILGGGD